MYKPPVVGTDAATVNISLAELERNFPGLKEPLLDYWTGFQKA